jgi:hypothetical protein
MIVTNEDDIASSGRILAADSELMNDRKTLRPKIIAIASMNGGNMNLVDGSGIPSKCAYSTVIA